MEEQKENLLSTHNGMDDQPVQVNQSKTRIQPFRNFTFLIYFVLLFFAYVVGTSIFANINTYFKENVVVWCVGAIAGGYILYTMLYEVGKVLFGKIAGYRLVRSNLFFFILERKAGRTTFSLTVPDGFGGHTFMVPDEKKRQRPLLYLFGGGIVVFACSILSLTLAFFIIPQMQNVIYALYIAFWLGFIITVFNLLPFWMDTFNDGILIRILLNKANISVYHDNLKQEEAMLTAEHPLQLHVYDNHHAHFQTKSLLYKYYYYLDQKEYQKAEAVCERIIARKAYALHEDLAAAYTGKFYIMTLHANEEEISAYYWKMEKDFRKHITSAGNLETIKTALWISAFLDVSFELYEHILHRIDSRYETYSVLRRDTEKAFIETMIQKIEEKFPDWKMEE